MADLSTSFMGIQLKNPIIVGSSGLTNSISKIKRLEDGNAAAVVIKSIFEEQLVSEADEQIYQDMSHYPEAASYLKTYSLSNNLEHFIRLIEDAKKSTSIPIIGSIHCFTSSNWVALASEFEKAGADALELNAFILPSDDNISGEQNEQIYFDIIENVRNTVNIPIALKMSHYSSGLANLIKRISWTGNVNGLVLFNRFHKPDIDLNSMKLITSGMFSTSSEIHLPLRWTALLSPKIRTDIAASTGIHDGEGIIKLLLAGAKAVQVASVLYEKGTNYVPVMLKEIERWMEMKNIEKLSSIIGTMSQENIENHSSYERIQFMKYFSGMD